MAKKIKDLPKCKRPLFINMGRVEEDGTIATAMVHRNQIADFQRDGWEIPPSEGVVDIPKQSFTDNLLRAYDEGDINLIEDSELRSLAAKDPELRDHALVQAGLAESIKNPDPEKVDNWRRQSGKGKAKRK